MSRGHIDTKQDSNVHIVADRVFVYGGGNGIDYDFLSSVEMLSIDKTV